MDTAASKAAFQTLKKATMANGGEPVLPRKVKIDFDPLEEAHVQACLDLLAGKPVGFDFKLKPPHQSMKHQMLEEMAKCHGPMYLAMCKRKIVMKDLPKVPQRISLVA